MMLESLSSSAMAWELVSKAEESTDWIGEPIVGPVPGDRVLIGTFDCTGSTLERPVRYMSFQATGVSGWSLKYNQAGVGNNWQDGVGVFVHLCA